MSTETTEVTVMQSDQDAIKTQISKFNYNDSAIAKLRDEFMALTIDGIQDKTGYKRVYEARQIVKGNRIDIEKKRKELKRQVIEVGNAIDGEAKRLTGLLAPIEEYLTQKEEAIDKAIEQIKIDASKKEAERIQKRIDALAKYGFGIDINEVQTITDEVFNELLKDAKKLYDDKVNAEKEAADAKKKAEEQKALEEAIEKKRIEDLRIANEAETKRLEAENLKFQQEKAKFEAEQKELADAKAKFEADKYQEEERKRAEALEKELFDNPEKPLTDSTLAEAEKVWEEKPLQITQEKELVSADKEKLVLLLQTLRGVKFPDLITALPNTFLTEYRMSFNAAAIKLKNQIEKL